MHCTLGLVHVKCVNRPWRNVKSLGLSLSPRTALTAYSCLLVNSFQNFHASVQKTTGTMGNVPEDPAVLSEQVHIYDG